MCVLSAAPTAPLNLEVVTITAFTISLQWDEPQPANGIITSYIVRYYRVSNPDDITLFSVTIEGTMAEVTGLRAFTDYVFRVSAETVEEGGFSEITQRTDESSTELMGVVIPAPHIITAILYGHVHVVHTYPSTYMHVCLLCHQRPSSSVVRVSD